MKTKFLPLTLLLLVLLNVVLIFMLIKKTHEKQFEPKGKNFLITQLNFSKEQKEKFLELDKEHRQKIIQLDHQIKSRKDILFDSFSEDNTNISGLTNELGNVISKKEIEIFTFFKSVRNLCSPEQVKKFDEIIAKALKKENRRPPHQMGPPPPRDGDMPPPPPRRDF